MTHILCYCLDFVLWYKEGLIEVCTCGHPFEEHISGRTCIGESEIK